MCLGTCKLCKAMLSDLIGPLGSAFRYCKIYQQTTKAMMRLSINWMIFLHI